MTRYLFVLPDMKKPTGGVNVALQMINILRADGFDAAVVYSNKHYEYGFFESACPTFYYPEIAKLSRSAMSTRRRLKTIIKKVGKLPKRGPPKNKLLTIAPDDVFVLPEVRYPEYSKLFPDNRCILLTQDVFLFCRALSQDRASGTNFIDRFDAIITTSDASRTAVSRFACRDSLAVLQSVFRPELDAAKPKRRQIIYMPRKRPEEATSLVGCLKGHDALTGWTFKAIQNVGAAELDQLFSESLIFLSFSQMEGFGLPPAEAMAAGCIVIGYTGVGGEEYFTKETGIPVADEDICAFADALIDTVTEYDNDPAGLDALRLGSAAHIAKRYNPDQMSASLLRAWQVVEARGAR